MQMWDRAGKSVPRSDSQYQQQRRKLFQIKGAVEAVSERHSTRSDFIPNTCDPVMQRQIASLLRVVTEQRDAEQSPEVLLLHRGRKWTCSVWMWWERFSEGYFLLKHGAEAWIKLWNTKRSVRSLTVILSVTLQNQNQNQKLSWCWPRSDRCYFAFRPGGLTMASFMPGVLYRCGKQ